MACLQKEVLEDLVDGELGERETAQAVAHIKSCDKCRREFSTILALWEGLRAAVARDACPPGTVLKEYAENALRAERRAAIQEHIDFCNACRTTVWVLTASEAQLTEWQAQEERAYRQERARTVGCEAAREALAGLLPIGLEFLDRVLDSAWRLALDLKARTAAQWPKFGAAGQLAGALGFAGAPGPEVTATSIILVTALLVAQKITDGDIEATAEAVTTAVREAALTLGAGKELRQRLVEKVPPLLLRFYGDSEARPPSDRRPA